MHTFTGRVKTFNGKYWTTTETKVQASNWQTATKEAVRKVIRAQPSRTRNEQVHVELIRVPKYRHDIRPQGGEDV